MWISPALAHGPGGVETSMGFIMPLVLVAGAAVYILFFLGRRYAPRVIETLLRKR